MFIACVRTCDKAAHPVQSGIARFNHYKHQPQHEFLVLKIRISAVVRVNKKKCGSVSLGKDYSGFSALVWITLCLCQEHKSSI